MADDPKPNDPMAHITDLARQLGEAVAKHPTLEKYAAAQEALGKDTEATRLLTTFEQKAATMMRNEQMGQVVGEAERRDLETIQQQLASNLKVKAYSIAQTDMTDLLRKVSQTWQRPVAEAQGDDPLAPQGSPQGGSRMSM